MKKFIKSILSIVLVISLLIPTTSLMFTVNAQDNSIKVGDTITLGTYNGKDIVWICVLIDENGPLMMTKDVLCKKAYDAAGVSTQYHSDGWGYIRKQYGSNCWYDSSLRQWLNSNEENVSYTHCPPNSSNVTTNPYDTEAGFLTNFTASEKNLIKTVSRIVNVNKYETKRNGYCDGGASDTIGYSLTDKSIDVKYYYYKNITDSVFLLNAQQLNAIYNSNKSFLKANETYWTCINVGNDFACYEHVYIINPDSTLGGGPRAYNGSYGVRPAFYLDVEKYEESTLTEESTAYIQEHIDFTNSTKYSNLMQYAGFYNSIWKYEKTDKNFTAFTSWKATGDIGKIVSLNFSDLFITDNPYDVILADILSSYSTDNAILSACSSILDKVFDVDSASDKLMKILQSSDEWDDSIDTSKIKETLDIVLGKSKESLIDGVFFSTKEYNLKEKHSEVYEILTKTFSKVDATKWNGLFSKLSNTSTIIGYINSASDIVDVIFDSYQKYIIANALLTTNTDVLGSLVSSGYNLPPTAQELFSESINEYLEVLDYDSTFGAVCNYMIDGSAKNVYDIFKGSLKTLTYAGIAKLFGVSAGSLNAVIFTFNTTYSFLDMATGLGDMSDTFFLLNAASLLEDALLLTTDTIADNLKSKNTLTNATRFDACWGLLQSVEQYCYIGLSKYISGLKRCYTSDVVITSILNFVNPFGFLNSIKKIKNLNSKLSDADSAIQVAVMFENEWKNTNCHGDSASSSKAVSVKCPTDVYVFDENNQTVLSIINNTIKQCSYNISALVDGNEKIFALPNDQTYSIKIVGTDKGTMTYSIFDISDTDVIDLTEYKNVELRKNCVYEGILYNDTDKTYNLELTDFGICQHTDTNHDGICDICHHDFTADCSHICHSENSVWQLIWKILSIIFKLFGFEEYRYCECGMAHW